MAILSQTHSGVKRKQPFQPFQPFHFSEGRCDLYMICIMDRAKESAYCCSPQQTRINCSGNSYWILLKFIVCESNTHLPNANSQES